MDELLQEFVDSRGVDMRVDRQRGVIRGVKLLGLESRNGRKYLAAALIPAVALYEGSKVNVNHPKGSPLAARDYQERLGLIRNVNWRIGQGLFGDLHFNPKHAIAEQLLWDAEHAPENVGFSHNVQARTSRQGEQLVVESILKVQSVDLVADPATTRGLFEAAATSSAGADEASRAASAIDAWTLDELRRQRPDLVEAILQEQRTQLSALEAQLDQLHAAQAAHERRRSAKRLLAEFHLPDPDEAGPVGKALVSDQFLEAILAAPSDEAMRQLVEQRAAVVHSARQWAAGPNRWPGKPVAREQHTIDGPIAPIDAERFARAIT